MWWTNLKVTPAIAAAVTDGLWEIDDVGALLPDAEHDDDDWTYNAHSLVEGCARLAGAFLSVGLRLLVGHAVLLRSGAVRVKPPRPLRRRTPPTRWVTVLSISLLTGIGLAFVTTIAAPNYVVWATAGKTTMWLLVVSPVIGVALIVYEKIRDRTRDVRWPLALVGLTALPLVGIMVLGTLLGF